MSCVFQNMTDVGSEREFVGVVERLFTVRGQSYLSRLPKYWPSIPLSAWRVCPPPQQRRGYTLAGRRGGWRFNILEDERDRIALLQLIISLRLESTANLRPYLDIFKPTGSPCHELTSCDNSTSMRIRPGRKESQCEDILPVSAQMALLAAPLSL